MDYQLRTPRPQAAARHRGPGDSINLALAFVRACFPVFPCGANKRPLIPRGFHAATTDETQIVAWWTRWPDALVGIPTGPTSGIWVLDVDGESGRKNLNNVLSHLALDSVTDLTPVIGRTPSGGFHLFFRLQPGERPHSRASDIGAGLDTRGVTAVGASAGYFIAPGNVLPDGRRYKLIDPATRVEGGDAACTLLDAPPAPRGLLFAATFNDSERAEIAGHPVLMRAIRAAEPTAWAAIIAEHRRAQRCAFAARTAHLPADADGMRQQALDDLREAAEHLTGLNDGRRNALFTTACRLAKYVSNHMLSDPEVRAALRDATAANGTVARYGTRFVDGVITRAFRKGAGDLLPPLADRFRTNGGRA